MKSGIPALGRTLWYKRRIVIKLVVDEDIRPFRFRNARSLSVISRAMNSRDKLSDEFDRLTSMCVD